MYIPKCRSGKMYPYALVFDVETVGQRKNNPTVSIGLALIDRLSNVVVTDGEESLFEVMLPMQTNMIEDMQVVSEFWMREQNIAQYQAWKAFNASPECPTLTTQVRKFIDFCDKVTRGRSIEKYVDTTLFDVNRLNLLLDMTDEWPGKPKSWDYLLLNACNERYYSPTMDIKCIYIGWTHLSPVPRDVACRMPGGIKAYLRHRYNVPTPAWVYQNDHYASHDAAKIGMDFMQIRQYCEE